MKQIETRKFPTLIALLFSAGFFLASCRSTTPPQLLPTTNHPSTEKPATITPSETSPQETLTPKPDGAATARAALTGLTVRRVTDTAEAQALSTWLAMTGATKGAPRTVTPTSVVYAPPTITVFTLNPVEELTPASAAESFSDLIVFTSEFPDPFLGVQLNGSREVGGRQLYAFSPDGLRAGRLSVPEFQTSIHFPPGPDAKPLLIEYGVHFNSPWVQGIPLPPECYEPIGEQKLHPCDTFKFSPNGRYLGFFYGPDECWRAILILNTQTGARLYQSERPNGHYFFPLDGGQAVIAEGHCEGGSVILYDFATRQREPLGAEGSFHWTSDRSAVVGEASTYRGIERWIWGYNFVTSQKFLQGYAASQITDSPIWAPDNSHLLYQQRTFEPGPENTYSSGTLTFPQARQIFIVDAHTGEEQVLLSDPAYDYHLGPYPAYPPFWHGDWIQVRRVHFTSETVEVDFDTVYHDPKIICWLYGLSCETEVQSFALNWKTGELIPWERTAWAHPTPTPQATPIPGPEMTGPPVYRHPSGRFAFYLGRDGHSLWMVPSQGSPQLWVRDGQDYFYLP